MSGHQINLGRSSIAGIMLFALFAVAGLGFALFNYQQIALLQALKRDGATAAGRVIGFTPSHKACNASIRVTYAAGPIRTDKSFQVCGGSYAIGQTVHVRYLPATPARAMIDAADAPFDPANYPRGLTIGALVGIFGLVMAVRAWRKRQGAA